MDYEYIKSLLDKLDEVTKKISENEDRLKQIDSELKFWQIVTDEFYNVKEDNE